MISRPKNSAGPTSWAAASISPGLARSRPFQVLVGVLDHDDGGVHHGADGDGDAAQTHDVGVDPQHVHDDKGDQTPPAA